MKLPDDILDAIDVESNETKETKPIKKTKEPQKLNSIKKFDDDLNDTTFSDFIPLKTFS